MAEPGPGAVAGGEADVQRILEDQAKWTWLWCQDSGGAHLSVVNNESSLGPTHQMGGRGQEPVWGERSWRMSLSRWSWGGTPPAGESEGNGAPLEEEVWPERS